MKKFSYLLSVVSIIFLLFPVVSSADSLVGTKYTTGSGRDVTIELHGKSQNTLTVEFQAQVRDENGDLLDGEKWFEGFCVELEQYAQTGGVLPVDLAAPSLVDGGLHAAWLMENRKLYQQNHAGWSSYEIAGLQLAIWEVTHDYASNFNYSLSAGAFKVTKAAAQARDLANFYLSSLAELFNPEGLDNKYRISQHPDKQNFILNIPTTPEIAPVPEPGTLLLLGLGLLGILGVAKKRQK